MTITLTPELEQALAEHAREQGTTPELLALDSLRQRFLPGNGGSAPANQGSLADYLAGFIGVIHSSEAVPGGARMSEHTGRKFAAGMHEKRRAGKL